MTDADIYLVLFSCVKHKTKIRILIRGTDNVNEMSIYDEINATRCDVIDIQYLLFAYRD